MASTSRPTRAQRRAAEEAEREREVQAFEKDRAAVWLRLWARACRLSLCVQATPECREEGFWWFDSFRVDALHQTFRCEGLASDRAPLSVSELRFDDVSTIEFNLHTGQSIVDNFLAAREKARREAEEKKARRAVALAKLTDEDIEALDVRR